jgi:hypothetical protein
MQPNIFSTTAKRITKMTSRAKAALEEKAATSSKKRKPDGNGNNETQNLKKAKTYRTTGTIPANSLTSANKDFITPVPTPSGQHTIVRTEEEAAFHVDVIDVDTEGSESESEKCEETAEDQRGMLWHLQ